MGDKNLIDGQKIEWHPDRVNQWLSGSRTVYPIYVEISPVGSCNHRCTFCAVDYLGYEDVQLPPDLLMERLSEMGKLGVKSVMFAGEGEPLLHRNIARIIKHTKGSAGIDVAVTTNATPITDRFVDEALPYVTWLKASINAGTPAHYMAIHRTKNSKDFERVWGNMGKLVAGRERLGLDRRAHTLGAQMVLLPENAPGAEDFVKRARETGLDYAVIKPYSQHTKSLTHQYEGMTYGGFKDLAEKLTALESDKFEVVFREKTMAELDKERQDYSRCPSTPHFWAYIMANGKVYGCSAYLTDDRFCYGDIKDQTFKEIWEGEKRMQSIDFVASQLDITECRRNCRMNAVNNTLEVIKNGGKPAEMPRGQTPAHANFI